MVLLIYGYPRCARVPVSTKPYTKTSANTTVLWCTRRCGPKCWCPTNPEGCAGHATLQGLDELRTEVDDLVEAVRRNLKKSARKLMEARMAYY